MAAGALIGREEELAQLSAFLARLDDGLGSLLVEGEPGIGKTALWQAGLDLARERGARVLAARPSGSEVQLSFAALGDLLEPVLEPALPHLRPPRRRALEVALLLREAKRAPPDERAVALAVLGILRLLAHDRPLVVAVDDVQWLDQPSARALEFVLRRLGRERIGFLGTVRRERGGAVALELDRALGDTVLQRVALGPLSLGALHRLVGERLSLALPRPALVRLHEASRGNPFLALELARELQRRRLELAPGQPLPLPDDLRELLSRRVARLPASARQALLVAAALASPTVELVEAAGEDAEPALERAARAGVVELDGDRVRFAHPLLASVCYADATPRRRTVVHRRLARIVPDPEERARHLALAAGGPDSEVAAALDEAAEHAAGRGAPGVAAELVELALGLTPAGAEEGRRGRALRAADHHATAGAFARAREILEELLAGLPGGSDRAEVLLRLAATREDDLVAMTALGEQALAEAEGDGRLQARIRYQLSSSWMLRGRTSVALDHARVGLELASGGVDPLVVARLTAQVGMLETWLGEVTPGLLERGVALERNLDRPLPFYESPGAVLGLRLMFLGSLDGARARLEQAHSGATEQADERSRVDSLFHLAELEYYGGNWSAAVAHAAAGLELEEQLGLEAGLGALLFINALLAACLGRVDEARVLAQKGAAISEASNEDLFAIFNLDVLGFVELSLGDWEAAARYLRPLPERLLSLNKPRVSRVWPDAIEALVGVGDLEQARAYLEVYASGVEQSRSGRALAIAERCRGVADAAGGELADALEAFERALAWHERSPEPFERARTLLALGSTRRRAKQKRAARETLEQALAELERLGASLWAEKARAELARLSGRAPASGELTPTEQRVASLVAQGLSNKEVAAALYVSVHTVEAHLSRIYRKLGVRSRSALAHRFGAGAAEAPGAKV